MSDFTRPFFRKDVQIRRAFDRANNNLSQDVYLINYTD